MAKSLTQQAREQRRRLESGEVDPVFFRPGALCFVPDAKAVWFPGKVVHNDGEKAVIDIGDGHEVTLPISVIKPREHSRDLADMAEFNYLHDASILHNVRVRFEKDQIYTYTGPILIAVNPFKKLELYDDSFVKKYAGKSIGELPPHVYAVADSAYRALCHDGTSQSLIISGESGAGKTVSTKLMLRYLTAVASGGKGVSRVQQQILDANPILEAFGNAKTLRNDNSSRFGKYIEVFMDKGVIVGGTITNYLLEKVRLVWQQEGERNYHIFYYLVAGASPEERAEFHLPDARSAASFHYLGQSGVTTIKDVNDAAEYAEVKKAMGVCGFSADQQRQAMRLTAALLHLGNVEFRALPNDSSEVAPGPSLGIAAKLLELDEVALRHALCNRRLKTREGDIQVSLKKEQAQDTRDAFAKAIYGKLFDWLVSRINDSIRPAEGSKLPFIGVLDIFGFEVFKHNSFEQFCINFCNEKLQQLFNNFVFKMELAMYKREGVDTSSIVFIDNQDTLDLIEKRPDGIMPMLDEESVVPNGSDDGFLFKIHQKHANHDKYRKPRLNFQSTFILRHYAGDVQYETKNFLDKNNDKIHLDLLQMLVASRSKLLAGLFQASLAEAEDMANSAGRKKILTLGLQFREQLAVLNAKMQSTAPHYIRCIRPNADQSPGLFVPEPVLHQLQYSGVLESIRVRRCGYPQRADFTTFYREYRVLAPDARGATPRDACVSLIRELEMEAAEIQVGVTKVFMRWGTLDILEDRKIYVLGVSATTIQRSIRRYLAVKHYRIMKVGFLALHAVGRGFLARKRSGPKLKELRRRQAALRAQMAEQRRLREIESKCEEAERKLMDAEERLARSVRDEAKRREAAARARELAAMAREDAYVRRLRAAEAEIEAQRMLYERQQRGREDAYGRRIRAEEARLLEEAREEAARLDAERRAERDARAAMAREEQLMRDFIAEERRLKLKEIMKRKQQERMREVEERIAMRREEVLIRLGQLRARMLARRYARRWKLRFFIACKLRSWGAVHEELLQHVAAAEQRRASDRAREVLAMTWEDEIAAKVSTMSRKKTLRARMATLVATTNKRIKGRRTRDKTVFQHDAAGNLVEVPVQLASSRRKGVTPMATAGIHSRNEEARRAAREGAAEEEGGSGGGGGHGGADEGSYDSSGAGGSSDGGGSADAPLSTAPRARALRKDRILSVLEDVGYLERDKARAAGLDDTRQTDRVHDIIRSRVPVEEELHGERRRARFREIPKDLGETVVAVREDAGMTDYLLELGAGPEEGGGEVRRQVLHRTDVTRRGVPVDPRALVGSPESLAPVGADGTLVFRDTGEVAVLTQEERMVYWAGKWTSPSREAARSGLHRERHNLHLSATKLSERLAQPQAQGSEEKLSPLRKALAMTSSLQQSHSHSPALVGTPANPIVAPPAARHPEKPWFPTSKDGRGGSSSPSSAAPGVASRVPMAAHSPIAASFRSKVQARALPELHALREAVESKVADDRAAIWASFEEPASPPYELPPSSSSRGARGAGKQAVSPPSRPTSLADRRSLLQQQQKVSSPPSTSSPSPNKPKSPLTGNSPAALKMAQIRADRK
jgi:myosin heavy subunit